MDNTHCELILIQSIKQLMYTTISRFSCLILFYSAVRTCDVVLVLRKYKKEKFAYFVIQKLKQGVEITMGHGDL